VTSTLDSIPDAERLRVDVPGGLTVHVDPGLLDRVLANLVENALHHTPQGTKISLTAAPTGGGEPAGRVQVRVVDHGDGVPADRLDGLFLPFQRLGDVPQGEGLGLGLAVARGLTEAMGGTVRAEETAGGGLTVVVDLPTTTGNLE
jgi:two-component system sensor histidine kinase KdpD